MSSTAPLRVGVTTARSSYRWFPWAIAGAMAFVIGVNLVLTYFAFSSAPRLVTAHPFNEGNGYNDILAAAARQDALGWKTTLGFARAEATHGTLAAAIADRSGQPVRGLAITAYVDRPVGASAEKSVTLREARPGHYEAPAEFGALGQWEVRLVARRGETLYEHSERIVLE